MSAVKTIERFSYTFLFDFIEIYSTPIYVPGWQNKYHYKVFQFHFDITKTADKIQIYELQLATL